MACRPWIVLSSSTGNTLRALWTSLNPEARASYQACFTDRACATAAVSRELAPAAPVYTCTKESVEAEALTWLQRKKLKDPLILCCGYFRLISPTFIEQCGAAMVNTHPSLLPAFPGLDKKVHEAALAGACLSGFSIHLVNEALDGGPVLFQAPVPILPGDTADTLRDRVRKSEQAWLGPVWQKLLTSDLRPEDRNSSAYALRARLDLNLNTFTQEFPNVNTGRPARV